MVGTNYNLCPVGPKTKENKNQQKSPTSQKKPLEGMQAVLGNRPIQTEVIKAALIFNAHPTMSPTVCPSFSPANRQGTWEMAMPFNRFPRLYTTSLSLSSLLQGSSLLPP